MFSISPQQKSIGMKFHFVFTKFLLSPPNFFLFFLDSYLKLSSSEPIKTKGNLLPSIFNKTGERS